MEFHGLYYFWPLCLFGHIQLDLLLGGYPSEISEEKEVNNPALKHRGLCEAHAKRPLHKLNG